ncbi:MAG: peptidase M23, partial [Ruminococcus sp.]|nr:peptidase M23 [Ruminococcus sp.]
MKRCLACAVSAVLCLSLMVYSGRNGENVQSASAISEEAQQNENEISEAQKQIQELMDQQKQLDSQIQQAQGDIKKEEETQKAINKQIETVQKTILALETSITELNGQISELTTDIEKSEIEIIKKREEIDTGTDEFKKRLRALYIVGDDSYSSMIAGSTDFYDMLMKLELVKRVANHDNEMIDNLISLKAQFEADNKELEGKKATLEENK